jgi:RNA polymerase sigma factor (sigma-70 family)
MRGGTSRQILKHLSALYDCGVTGAFSDEELLEQFVAGSDEAAEAGFSALVKRHGPMVLGVCRRVLGDRHTAEDAFQATFLVLARKALALSRREQLASWLHGVAWRVAADARARAARRHANEKRLRMMSPAEDSDEIHRTELRSILDEELAGLPERHRTALVLCELEGLSRREAAGRLGVSEGTLSSRLARAKIRLRERLIRRGITLSAAAFGFALGHDAQAVTVRSSLLDSTIRVATLVGTGSPLAGVASTSVTTLTEGVLKAMLISKLKFAFLGLVTLVLATTGAGVIAQDRPSDDDRLKNLERKLDRLLETLGTQNRRVPPTSQGAESRPAPTQSTPELAPVTPAPAAPAVVATVPQPPQPPTAPAVHPFTAANPTVPPAVIATAPATPLPVPSPGMPPPGPPRQTNSLAGRIDTLEHRLANLERRLAEFERRMEGQGPGMSPPPMFRNPSQLLPTPRPELAPLPSLSSSALPARAEATAPAPLAPPVPPTASGPSALPALPEPAPVAEPPVAPESPSESILDGTPTAGSTPTISGEQPQRD